MHTHTHTHTHTSNMCLLSLARSLARSRSLSYGHKNRHAHTHTHTRSLTHTLSLPLACVHKYKCKHKHTHKHTHKHRTSLKSPAGPEKGTKYTSTLCLPVISFSPRLMNAVTTSVSPVPVSIILTLPCESRLIRFSSLKTNACPSADVSLLRFTTYVCMYMYICTHTHTHTHTHTAISTGAVPTTDRSGAISLAIIL